MGARDIDLKQDYLNYVAAMAKGVAAACVATLTDDQTTMIGEGVALQLCEDMGGRPQPYIAKGRFYQAKLTEERVMQALADARRARHVDPYGYAADQTGLALLYVRQVEKRVIKAQVAERQGTLAL